MSLFLTKCEVLALYEERLCRWYPRRDEGLLEAALFRPQTGYYADLIEEAAASLGKSQPKSRLRRWKQTRRPCGDRVFFSASTD